MLSFDMIRKEETLPVILIDAGGKVLYINAAFQETYQWRPGDLLGKNLTLMIPERLRDAHNMGLSRFLVTGQPKLLDQPLDLTILTRDGRELAAEHYITTGRQDGQVVFAATIRLKAADRA